MNRGRGWNRTAVSLSVTCPLFESDLCDCIALFDALTTPTAAAVHILVCSRLSSSLVVGAKPFACSLPSSLLQFQRLNISNCCWRWVLCAGGGLAPPPSIAARWLVRIFGKLRFVRLNLGWGIESFQLRASLLRMRP